MDHSILSRRELGEMARKLGGHGGMDYLMCYRLVQCMREELEPDIDVYDAAAWSAPGPLSQVSVARGSMPVKSPDFTRGLWRKRPAFAGAIPPFHWLSCDPIANLNATYVDRLC